MQLVLCKKCETGNATYLRECSSCGADLYAPENEPDIPVEVDPATRRRNATIAIVLSIATTAFKIWMLYGLRGEAHQPFPGVMDISLIATPPVAAAIASAKSKRWYWILFLDSFVMIAIFAVIVVIMVAAKLKGR